MLSAEVAQWYQTLAPADIKVTDKMIGLLKQQGNQLRMPHSKPLGDGLFELRFAVQRGTVDQRITYTYQPDQLVITLTAFRKTRNNERREIERARQAKADFEKGSRS